MSFLFRASEFTLSVLPYKLLVLNYAKLKKTKLTDVVDKVLYKKFFRCSHLVRDFDNYLNKADRFKKYCVIQSGTWDYKIMNFHFIRDMMSLIIWCLENGYKPIIDYHSSLETDNLWDKLYEQPYHVHTKDVDPKKITQCPINEFIVVPQMFDVFDDDKVMFWNKFISRFLSYHESTREYISSEIDQLIKGKRVLGCLCRGKAYTEAQPKGHPVQPDFDELVEKVSDHLADGKYDFIYLATEENRIAEKFISIFGEKILINKRHYNDVSYDENDLLKCSRNLFNNNDKRLIKLFEYHSSINILANCDSIVAGLCGGSEFAVYINGNTYNKKYIFNKGKY